MADVWVAAGDALVRADAILEIKGLAHGEEARVAVKTVLDSYVVSVTAIPEGDPSSPEDVRAVALKKATELADQIARHSDDDHYHLVVIDLNTGAPVS